MPDNAFVKIGTALLKHQVKKLVGEELWESSAKNSEVCQERVVMADSVCRLETVK